MMEWQPIETAPKDGTELLLYLGGEIDVGFFPKWYSKWTDGFRSLEPTHWMPLPEPPK